MPAKNNTNLGLAACFQTNTLFRNRHIRMYHVVCAPRLSLKNTPQYLQATKTSLISMISVEGDFVRTCCTGEGTFGIKRGNIGVLAGFGLFLAGITQYLLIDSRYHGLDKPQSIMCSVVFGLHYFVCRSDKVHFCHITFFQKRIDFVEQIPRNHRSEIAARLLTLVFVALLVTSSCRSARRRFFLFHNKSPLAL